MKSTNFYFNRGQIPDDLLKSLNAGPTTGLYSAITQNVPLTSNIDRIMGKGSIDIDGFRIIRKLGNGARTSIYLAVDEDTRQTVALKRAILEGPEDSRIFEQMEMELKVARQVDHPYVRKCNKSFRIRRLLKTQELLLVMEYFDEIGRAHV